jgi:TIR domain
MASGSPVFISYSRKDYYFAESLARRLSARGIPVWFDVEDLSPGRAWEQDLEAALDRAPAMVLVASPKSSERPNVRKEWERAKKQGKRVIVAEFRGWRLGHFTECESVDFRRAFGPALEKLISLLGSDSAGPRHRLSALAPPGLPPWVLVLLLTLLIPSLGYGFLADWNESEPDWSPAFEFVMRLLLPVFAFGLAWFFCFSFVRRRMGMARLVTCLACLSAFYCYPLLLTLVGLGVAGLSSNLATASTDHPGRMLFLAAVPLTGIAIVLLVRPEDLLRWTPTGRAWNWYRASCGARLRENGRWSSPLKQVRQYRLFHDPVDQPAADELKRILTEFGAEETQTLEASTPVLLLTNRTRDKALTPLASGSESTVLTVVGSPISLPERLDWLWRHQWVDFRHWSVKRFDAGLPLVPEAVTGTRFPFHVRIAHHFLCALSAMVLLVPADNSQSPVLILAALACVWSGLLARRLLRRSVSESAFFRGWLVGWAAMATSIVLAFYWGQYRPAAIVAGVVYLAAFPLVMIRVRPRLSFWFPSAGRWDAKRDETLMPGGNWQTLLWLFVYAFPWIVVRGGF